MTSRFPKDNSSTSYPANSERHQSAAFQGASLAFAKAPSNGPQKGPVQPVRPISTRPKTSGASQEKAITRPDHQPREQPPSHVAAVLAASSRNTSQHDLPMKIISRHQSRQPSLLGSLEDLKVSHAEVEITPGETDSLVKLFESKEKTQRTAPVTRSVRYGRKSPAVAANARHTGPQKRSFSSATVSLRPTQSTYVRKRGNTMDSARNTVEEASTNSLPAVDQTARPARKAMPMKGSSAVGSGHAIRPVASFQRHPTSSLDGPQDNEDAMMPHSVASKPPARESLTATESFLNNAALTITSKSGRSPTRPSMPTRHTEPNFDSLSKAALRPPASEAPLDIARPGHKMTRISDGYIPQLTVDSLANAMVASSLASSRAPSPTKPPPLPPPRRHGKHSFLHHHRTPDESRTPSPAKGMRQTMREPPKSDDEDDNTIRKHRSHLMRKHPNKHHEGDRKRYRTQVTERERKRYEGVWAANKGILLDVDSSNAVVNIVVRDIWKRSRLPDDVLEEVWDLVDTKGKGSLDREEFVVGMFLIDQRLKGNKLPFKVSDSVWSSVRRLTGVNGPRDRR